MLSKAKDLASSTKREVLAAEVLASQASMNVVEAFRARKEYHLEVLEANRDAFQ